MNQQSQTQNFGGGQMMGGQNFGLQQGGSQVVNPQTLQRIHQNSIFGGSSQSETALGGFGQGSMMSSVGGSFGGQSQGAGQMMGGQNFGMQQGGQTVNPQILERIHQNSIFGGHSQFDGGAGSMQASSFGGQNQGAGAGQMSSFGGGFMAGQLPNFGGQNQGAGQMMGGQSYGMQQQGGAQMVNPQTLQRIHQNSIFQGKSQPDNAQVQRIHQNSIFGGHSQFDGAGSMQAGFGGGFMAGQLPNFGGQNQGAGQMMGGQGFGMQQGGQMVNQQTIQRIHDNSIFQGKSQPDSPEVERIHQNSIFGGHSQFDGAGSMQASGFGGGFMAGQLPNFGGQNQGAGSGQMSSFGGGFMAGQLPNFGGQNQGAGQMMGGQGYGIQQQGGAQMVNPQTLQRIHNNSIFQGASQPDNPQVQRIHQNSIFGGQSQFGGAGSMQASGFGGSMSAGQLPNFGGQNQSFGAGQMMGGQGQQQMMNTAAFNAVLNADAGIQDNEGPSRYPASMYTGSNQYDQVNQGVVQQMGNMGGQTGNQTFGSF